MMETYRMGTAGAIKRIGAPHEHDVLSGRGGAINSHIGNARFREYVRERKNSYNLARTKAAKAIVANEVMDLIRNQSPPGRFLQRDQSSVTGGVTWWVEVDSVKAMAKVSQALREGAPSIRAAHKDELTVKKRTRKNTKKTTPTTGKRSHQTMQQAAVPTATIAKAPAVTIVDELKANVAAAPNTVIASPLALPSDSVPAVAPLPLSAMAAATPYGQPAVKRSRLSENLYLPDPQPHIVRPTPPLAPLPSPTAMHSMPELGESLPMPAIPVRESSLPLRRTNSLALSDVGSGCDNWGTIEFVNPFEGDTTDELAAMPTPFDPFTNTCERSRNSLSNTSVKSELSDLCDTTSNGLADTEFGEGMKSIYDSLHPGLASAGEHEPIPTHLYPYRGTYDVTKAAGGAPQLIQ